MKGYGFENSFKEKLLNEYNNEYGLNFSKIYTDEDNADYERFFNTKNNLNIHKKIHVKK